MLNETMLEGMSGEDGARRGADGAVEARESVGETGIEKASGVEGAPGPGRANTGDAAVELDHSERRVRERCFLVLAAVERGEGPPGLDEGGAQFEDAVDGDEDVEVGECTRARQADAEEADGASLEDDQGNAAACGEASDLAECGLVAKAVCRGEMEGPDELVGSRADLGPERARYRASADAGREVEPAREVERRGRIAGRGDGEVGFCEGTVKHPAQLGGGLDSGRAETDRLQRRGLLTDVENEQGRTVSLFERGDLAAATARAVRGLRGSGFAV